MKTRIKLISTAMVAVFVGICLSSAVGRKLTKALNLESTIGDVRVVLLRVGPVISTNGPRSFAVTYAVEVPAEGAFSDLHFKSATQITLSVRGKPVQFGDGFSSGAMDFTQLPRQDELMRPATREGKAMLAMDVEIENVKIKAKKVDVKIQFAWRGKEQKFEFKDVPLN